MSGRRRAASRRRRMDRAVLAIAAEGFLSRLSFGVVGFALPLYAVSLGMSVAGVGLLLSVNVLVQLAAKPMMGVVADRFGHRPTLVCAIAMRSAIPLLFVVAHAPWALFSIRMLYGLAQSMRDPALLAIIADVGGKKKVASTFAWYQTAKNTAASVGRAAAAFLLAATASVSHRGGSFTLVFVIAFGLSLLPMVVVVRGIARAPARPQATAVRSAAVAPKESEPVARAERFGVLRLTTLGFLFGSVAGMLNLFPVIAVKYMHVPVADVGVIVLVSTAFVLVGGPVFGWLADNVSRKVVLLVRGPANALSSLMYLALPTPIGVGVSKTVDDLGKVAFRPAWGSVMAEVARRDPARRARVMSRIDTGEDAGDAAGPLLAGALLSIGGLPLMLGVRVVLAVATEIVAIRATRHLGEPGTERIRKRPVGSTSERVVPRLSIAPDS